MNATTQHILSHQTSDPAPSWIGNPIDLRELARLDTRLALAVRAFVHLAAERDWLNATRIAHDITGRLRLIEAAETARPPHPIPENPAAN